MNFDVIIVGSGTAGLTAALRLPKHLRVALICKSDLAYGASIYAQGGIAAVMDSTDSLDQHIADTIGAGAGLCDENVVSHVVSEAKENIEWLISTGVSFSQDEGGEYHLTQEGGHTRRRVLHANDATGKAVQGSLAGQVASRPNIFVLTHHMIVDLVMHHGRCVGGYFFDIKSKKVKHINAHAVVLATGGASWAYLYTTCPVVSSGDGVAMAYRAGCYIANMEFNQFHPTCLYHPQAGSFLITEAMRGEGAKLILPDGMRFMPSFDARGEMAPRDIVARAIDDQMKRFGLDSVFLDISFKSQSFIENHFPTIYKKCLSLGIDITKSPIPVVPAAHYTCGGIVVDQSGQTDVDGLYAAGEVTYTGLHGANRMASNSLLECLVYGANVAKHIASTIDPKAKFKRIEPWDESWVTDSADAVFVKHNWEEIRHLMWNFMGIVRSDKRLERAANRVALLKHEIQAYYADFRISADLLELRNLIVVADVMVQSAMARKESRGLHYTLDYPEANTEPKPTFIHRKQMNRKQHEEKQCRPAGSSGFL